MTEKTIDDFLNHLKNIDASHATIQSFHSDLKKFKCWFPEVSLESIGPLDIAEFKRHLQKRGQKPATINRALATLSTFFDCS